MSENQTIDFVQKYKKDENVTEHLLVAHQIYVEGAVLRSYFSSASLNVRTTPVYPLCFSVFC